MHSKEIAEIDFTESHIQILHLLKISDNITGGNLPCFPLPGPSNLQNSTEKFKALNVF